MLTINSTMEQRENRYWRFFLAYYLLALHFLLSVGMVLFMEIFVNERLVNSTNKPRGSQGLPYFRASDITTLVSAGLTIIRLVSAAWTAMCAWRCAFIVLEADGLTLSEFNRVVSWRVLWPRMSAMSLTISLVLLSMLPSMIVAPVLSGAVDWRSQDMIVSNKTVRYDNAMARRDDQWYWFLNHLNNRKIFAKRAAGFSIVAWTDPDATDKTCRHVMANSASMPLNSEVENATIPCLVVHGIDWDKAPEKTTTDIISGSSDLSLVGDEPLGYNSEGIGAVFTVGGGRNWVLRYMRDPRNHYNVVNSTVKSPAPTVFSGTMRVAILVATNFENVCPSVLPSMFGQKSDLLQMPGLHSYDNGYGSCFVTGTVNFTAGVIWGRNAKYKSGRVIELESEGKIQPDQWVMPALQLLPDIMNTVAIMNATSLTPWNNITGYATQLIRQSYSGIWDAMNEDFDRSPVGLNAREKLSVLQAIVSFRRVLLWCLAQGLVTISGIALWILQQKRARSVIVDVAAISLMVDSSRVLGADHGRLTNMSYVSSKDCPGRLRLAKKTEDGSEEPQFELELLSATRSGGYKAIE